MTFHPSWSPTALGAHHTAPHHCWHCCVPASKILIYTRTLSTSQLGRSLENLLNIKPSLFCSGRSSCRSCSLSRGALQGICITGMVSPVCPTGLTTIPEQPQELQHQGVSLMPNRHRNSVRQRGWNAAMESFPSGDGGSHGSSRAQELQGCVTQQESGSVLTQQSLGSPGSMGGFLPWRGSQEFPFSCHGSGRAFRDLPSP